MVRHGHPYLPRLSRAKPRQSLYEVKTVLIENERDDGRPTHYHQKSADNRVVSILGGKIDNIYDLIELVRGTGGEFEAVNARLLLGNSA
jgi:hypothetical protein